MTEKPSPTRKIVLFVDDLQQTNFLTNVSDTARRLAVGLSGRVLDGGPKGDANVLVFLSDATAQALILSLLPIMRPRARNSLLRFIEREGLGPPVARAKPSKPR